MPGARAHDGLEHLQVACNVVAVVPIRETGSDERIVEAITLTDANPATVELGTLTARRGEDLLAQRVVDDTVLELSAVAHGDRYGELWESMNVVGRPVEGIDDPFVFMVALPTALLGKDRVVGIEVVNDLDNRCLGEVIDLGDELVAALLGDLQRIELIEVPNHQLTGPPGGLDSDVDHGVHRDSRLRAFVRLKAAAQGGSRIHARAVI